MPVRVQPTSGSVVAMQEQIAEIGARATAQLRDAATLEDIVAWERAYLGPKGELTLLLRGLGSLSPISTAACVTTRSMSRSPAARHSSARRIPSPR